MARAAVGDRDPRRPSGAAATLVEVARAARVSPSTVSRILNGTARVAEAKKRAVEDAIARLGFRPNPMAHGLRKGRRMTIGVLAPEVDSPFFGGIFRGLTEALAGSDYVPVVVGGPTDRDSEASRVVELLSRRVDGIVVVTCRLGDDELRTFAASVPMVVSGRSLRGDGLFSMKLDNALGGELATRHLLELGHRRIAHLHGPFDHLDAVDRAEGYRRALLAHGVRYDPGLVVQGGFLPPEGLAGVERLLASGKRFTAIFAANDESAYGAHLGLHRRGLRVPQDVSLVGFDDLPGSRFTTPPLTTVRQPLEEIGRRAARSLLDLLHGRTPPTDDMPEIELVVRDSTARPR
jgi:LacI family transcriptional regulator